jgi:glycerol-3-phosphate acyltransferase PlsY
MMYLISVLFYLIGSIPTAYIFMKMKHGKNILLEGSGNVGARNVYDVTNSKSDGITVLIIDLLKGFVPVLVLMRTGILESEDMVVPIACLVLGHNFPVWTKFKGGRGLATGAGVMLAINPLLVVIWLVVYFVARKIIDNVHVASSIALIAVPPAVYFGKFDAPIPNQFLFLITSSICAIALLRHIVPVYEYLNTNK